MGLENRDYLREDDGQSERRFSIPTLSVLGKLIAFTVAVFLLQLITTGTTETPLGVEQISVAEDWLELSVPAVFRQGEVWRLLTYAFCHNRMNLMHIAMNMLTLFFAGRMVLSVVNEREFLWFYLAGAIWAGLISLLFCRFYMPQAHILGASGAVLAVLTLAAMHYPRQEVLLMGIIPPAYYLGNSQLMTMVALKMVNISLKHGNADVSAYAYALWGMVLGAAFGDYKTGLEYGELGIKLNARLKNEEIRCKVNFVFGVFIQHWRRPLQQALPHLKEAYQAGLESGDVMGTLRA